MLAASRERASGFTRFMASTLQAESAAQPGGEQWLSLGRALTAAGRAREAIALLQRAAAESPLDVDVYRALAAALQADGQQADAASARIAVDAISRRCAVDLYHVGWVYANHRQWAAAGHWFERAILIEPGLFAAHIGLAWALRQLDKLAGTSTCRAYRRLPAFMEARSAPGRRTVLLLCSVAMANIPFRHFLPTARNRLLRRVLDDPSAKPRGREARHEVVFNVIGEPDLAAPSRQALARIAQSSDRPLLNPPARVDRTFRPAIASLLGGIPHLCIPVTVRWRRDAAAGGVHDAIGRAGLGYPVIARPIGSHGGEGVVLIAGAHDRQPPPDAAEVYLTRYCDYRSADGFFRKYRVIFIDREPYPYHLAIGSHWLLHYATADMLSASWKTEEEHRFLRDPAAVLGRRAWDALHAVGRRMDLDYCGIDFSLLPDGRVLVFEANATMLARIEPEDDALRFKNAYVQRIHDAVETMLAKRVAAQGARRVTRDDAL
ncbi:hypothetical protein CAL14_10050 [Bordetella genomosp. 9]|nr:hypothetical protein CAL14_10050 [Bordetella genomosp. 9]